MQTAGAAIVSPLSRRFLRRLDSSVTISARADALEDGLEDRGAESSSLDPRLRPARAQLGDPGLGQRLGGAPHLLERRPRAPHGPELESRRG